MVTTRQDTEPRALFLERLSEAVKAVRADRYKPYRDLRTKMPLREIADAAAYSRGHFYELLNRHGVDRQRLRWWRPGEDLQHSPEPSGASVSPERRGTSPPELTRQMSAEGHGCDSRLFRHE